MSGEAPLTAAVIGCGRMGAGLAQPAEAPRLPPGWLPLAHAEAIRAVPGLKLVALCDSAPDRLEAAGRRHAVDALYADADQLLSDVAPDVLTIATRTPGRCALIARAVSSGARAIHAEKPLARSLTEAETALDAVRGAGAFLTVGTTRRFMATYRKAWQLLRDGAIGTLRHIAVEPGREMLMWGLPHWVDMLLFFADGASVEWVQASCACDLEAVHDNVLDQDPVVESAVIRFASGLVGSITCGGGLTVRLSGDDGTLAVTADGAGIELCRSRVPGSAYFVDCERMAPEPGDSGTATALKELSAAVRHGAPPSVGLGDIALGQRLLLAIAWSSLCDGRRVGPDEVPADFTVTGRFGDLYA